MDKETIKKLVELEYNAKLLERIRKIQNILLTTGAYHTHNMENLNNQFDRLNVPNWERQIVNKVYSIENQFSHKLLRELETLIDIIEKELKKDG